MTISDIEIKPWIEARILAFLNQAQSVKDITKGHEIMDNPETGHGYTIGVTVAQRILDQRNTQRYSRFKSVHDLDGIKGLGVDKINDLVFSFGTPAAEAFVHSLYEGILPENWKITPHSTRIEHLSSFRKIANNMANFKNWVGQKYGKILEEKGTTPSQAKLESLLLRKSFLEVFDIEHYGAIALTFWFYQVDADNWFTFESMRQACEAYLNYYPGFDFRQELRLFKGFKEEGLGATSTTQGTLPVVVNYAEQTFTIWELTLND